MNILARLHLSAEELLLYPWRQRPHAKMLGQNDKVLKFQSFYIFSCILSLLIILIKPLTKKLKTGAHPVTATPLVCLLTTCSFSLKIYGLTRRCILSLFLWNFQANSMDFM